MAANPLIGYAFLKVNFTEKVHDLLDLTLPLTRRALHQWTETLVTTEALQRKIEDVWGMVIPQYVLRYMLPRLAKLGVVSFDPQKKIYKLSNVQTAAPEIIKRENEAREIYNRVLTKINAELLREGISNINARSVLESFLDGGALAFISRDNPASNVTSQDEVSVRIMARVIGVTSDVPNASVLNDLEDLVVGDLLYKAVHAISEGDAFDPIFGKMAGVKVFLDTGVLFRSLGYFGTAYERPAQEMLNVFKATGCEIHTFEHNLDEVIEGLHAVAQRLHTGGAYGPIVAFVAENGLDRISLIEQATVVPKRLADQGILVTQLPPMTKELSIDELLLDWRVETDVKQNNPVARRRDVDSLAAIYRLRDGKPQRRLERCPAIFVTSNRSLADASTRYFQKMFKEEGHRNIVQICMTDVILTTRLWLKVPTQFRNIPRNQILAHAHSSLRPSTEVVTRFLSFIRARVNDRRLTPEAALEVSFSRLVRELLVIEAENDPSRLNDEVIDDIIVAGLEKVRVQKELIRTEAEAKGARSAELEAMKIIQELELTLQQSHAANAATQHDRDTAQQQIEALSKEIEMLRASRVVSDRVTRWTLTLASPLCWILLICGIGVPLLTVLAPRLGEWWQLQVVGAVVSIIMSILTVIGISYFDASRRLETWIHEGWSSVFRFILRNPSSPQFKREPKP